MQNVIYVSINVNSDVFAEVSTKNHLRLCNSIMNITFMHVCGNLATHCYNDALNL